MAVMSIDDIGIGPLPWWAECMSAAQPASSTGANIQRIGFMGTPEFTCRVFRGSRIIVHDEQQIDLSEGELAATLIRVRHLKGCSSPDSHQVRWITDL